MRPVGPARTDESRQCLAFLGGGGPTACSCIDPSSFSFPSHHCGQYLGSQPKAWERSQTRTAGVLQISSEVILVRGHFFRGRLFPLCRCHRDLFSWPSRWLRPSRKMTSSSPLPTCHIPFHHLGTALSQMSVWSICLQPWSVPCDSLRPEDREEQVHAAAQRRWTRGFFGVKHARNTKRSSARLQTICRSRPGWAWLDHLHPSPVSSLGRNKGPNHVPTNPKT